MANKKLDPNAASALKTIGAAFGQGSTYTSKDAKRAALVDELKAGKRSRKNKAGKVVERELKAVDYLKGADRLINSLGGDYSDIPSEVAKAFDWKTVAASVETFAKSVQLDPAKLLPAFGIGVSGSKGSKRRAS